MEPVSPTRKRNESIDAIRGFSLFGILLVNLLSFHSPHFMYGGLRDFYSNGFDAITLGFIDIFAQASFYPLFSMLFGIGIYMMYERLHAQGNNAMTVLKRRMLILASLGLIHGLFIWYGDILLTYGVIGLLSLLFIKKPSLSLLKWSLSLLLIGATILVLISFPVREQLEQMSVSEAGIQVSYDHYTGNLQDVMKQNLADWKYSNDPFMWVFSLFNILPLFLLGMFLQKRGWLQSPDDHSSSIKQWLMFSFLLFITIKVSPYLFGNPLWFESVQDTIGGSALSVVYLLTALLFFNSRNAQMIKRILSNVGRLSLSNYLMQSLFSIFIFYGIGLNLYGKLHAFTLVIIALVIYSFQLLFSSWYIKRFHYGPFEWLYRSLTYGQRQRFIKKGD
ncbi:DUF418 domain-containing protein [Piscibacillus salipiscarius]|uniref:DUF418 domain-containing protein n=1 Tax=Piscibacillus salipiscarius TaxID=299480 RepID=A0ABW5QCL6_9BACI|nr:DUF418 domain-containing protein [Piscibacillus salipiscarius]